MTFLTALRTLWRRLTDLGHQEPADAGAVETLYDKQPRIHEITDPNDHGSWLREQMARHMDTEAEFEDLARSREIRSPHGLRSKVDAHATRADAYRQMAADLRAAAPKKENQCRH